MFLESDKHHMNDIIFVFDSGSHSKPRTLVARNLKLKQGNLLHKFQFTKEQGPYGSTLIFDPGGVNLALRTHPNIIMPWDRSERETNRVSNILMHKDSFKHFKQNLRIAIDNMNQFFISGHEGDTTIHNRVMEALCKRILQAHKAEKCFRVIIVIPLLPGFQGGMDDAGAAPVRALMHWQYRTICRGENSLFHRLRAELGSNTSDYISFYGLRTYGTLSEGGPTVTSQVYVHSKLMIIDDRVTLVGSSNINDRSLLGSRDSEIGVVIEDKDFVESSMNGQSWMAGKFSRSLRVSLWAEHLGLSVQELNQIQDPVTDRTYKNLWMETAEANSIIYQVVFGCAPNDHIHSRQKMSELRENIGYTTIDLGVAPQVVTLYEDGLRKASEMLKSVKGHVVCFPLEYMRDEDLRPMFHEGEFYTSDVRRSVSCSLLDARKRHSSGHLSEKLSGG